MKFKDRLLRASRTNRSLVCVGLDFEMERVPANVREQHDPILTFNQAIIEATKDLVCAYKPNIAFYEKHAERGLTSLRKTVELVPEEIPVILDCKRGDIGSTARAYAEAYFEDLGVDAITVNPYLGTDSVEPYLTYEEKGVFIVCRTTNAGASDFQDLNVNGAPLYEHVARRAVKEWNGHDTIGLVAPATQPRTLQAVRRIAGPNVPILVPGVGAQGGRVVDAVQGGANLRGEMVIVNASRSVTYASEGNDFAAAARAAAQRLKDECNEARNVSISP
jgi:orotidine-5'-phosphate decarboxylase